MPEDRNLDRLIDAALATYADAHPGENLAEHILTRLANEPAPRPRLAWQPWAIVAFSAAIYLLLLVHSRSAFTKPYTAPPIQSALVQNPTATAGSPHTHGARTPGAARQINGAAPHRQPFAATAVPQPLPKLDVFPTPTPLTRQERALAVYIAHTPQAEQEALAQSEQEAMPLTVASIHVMPLEAPDDALTTK